MCPGSESRTLPPPLGFSDRLPLQPVYITEPIPSPALFKPEDGGSTFLRKFSELHYEYK
jgi:hypothetical protein